MPGNDILGSDLLLDEDGDLQFGPNGDLMTTDDYDVVKNAPFSGYYNFLLSTFEKIKTIKGQYLFDPEDGGDMPLYIGSNIESSNMKKMKEAVKKVLSDDARVKNINSVDLEPFGNTVLIKANILLIGQKNPETLIYPQILFN